MTPKWLRVAPLAMPLALLGLLTAGAAGAPGVKGTPSSQGPPGPAADSPLRISADHMSGTHDELGDVVLLEGSVRIMRAGTVITSRTGTYHRATGMLFLQGGVTIVDSASTITCDDASYSENDDIVRLNGHVRARDRQGTLESPAAIYDRQAGRADLFGGVHGRYDQQRMESDSASYFRDSSVVHARGNVRGTDDPNGTTLRARAVDYDRTTREAEARGEPSLEERDADGRTSRISARVLRVNTTTRVAEAIDSVRVSRDSLQARGDYGLFDDAEQRGWLIGHPRAWDDETTVTGDTLEIRTREREVERVVVRGGAVLDYRGNRPGSAGETSRLTGDRVDVFFAGEDIDSLVSIGNAKNEYVAVAAKGKTAERNVAEGDTIRVYLEDGKIEEARVQGKAHGEYRFAVAVADTNAAKTEIVSYEALAIHYLLPKNRILLEGDSHLTYGELDLKARRVQFDSEEQTLVAEGEPELVDKGDKVTGHLMTYDLESRVGNIYQAETAYEKGLYHGERIRKVNDNELQVLSGSYSTCDRPDPHYHFSAKWMKIYIKDKLVAKPVVFYVSHTPLLALPFWIFPIRPGRHSGLLFPQFELGFSNRAGRFLRNAGYYWAPNDYFDLTTSGDYYSFEPSWVVRAEGIYKLLYVLDGDFRATYAKNEGLKTEDWDLDADHSQELTPRTRLTARASFVSSKDYNSSNLFGRTIAQRLNRFLTSNLAITNQADWASTSIVIDRRQDLDADQSIEDPDGFGPAHGPPPGTLATLANLTTNFPTVSVSFPTRAIGSLPVLRNAPFAKRFASLYLSMSARFQSFRERRAFVSNRYQVFDLEGVPDSIVTLDQRITSRWGAATSTSLTDSRRLFGWINVQPGLSADMALFDFDQLGHRVVPTGTWAANVASSASLYGTIRRKIGPVTGIRHVVAPRVSFSYSPEFDNLFFVDAQGFRRPRFNSFGTIGVSGFKRERLDFGLDQRLQVKLGSGETARRLDNLASLTAGGSYDFLYKEHGAAHPLSPLGVSLFLQPPTVLNASSAAVVDPYQGRPLRSLSYNVGLNLQSRHAKSATPDLPVGVPKTVYYDQALEEMTDAWSLGLAYSYTGGYSGPFWTNGQTANLVWRMRMTPAWNVNYSTSFDVTNHAFGIQQFSLTRDLHCWTATFSRTFAPGGEAEYYFKLAVKDQKELYLERGTRTGSIGGLN